MPRMFALSPDDTIRLYEGNRTHGGPSDAELREAVGKLAGDAQPPVTVVLGAQGIQALLKERAATGLTISCEDSQLMPAAKKLAAALEKAGAKSVRITRNAPRIKANRPFFGLGGCGQVHDLIEQPDIILGGRHNSHSIARYAVTMTYNTTLPLPFMAGREFPGAGRAIVMLTRPYERVWGPGRPERDEKELFKEQPARQVLVIGASDVTGAAAGVDEVVRLTNGN